MKKLIPLLILLLCGIVQSQNRFKYVLHFKIDSTDRNMVQQENFNLDYIDGKSIFYSEALANLDSVRNAGTSIYRSDVPDPKLDYIITFDSQNRKLTFTETIGFSMYRVEEPRSINWKITNETKSIDGYNAQKAVCNFGGRNWTAWFTKDISIPAAPYKFTGLPGLIVSLADDDNDYVFNLASIQKIQKLYDFRSFEKLGIKTIQVDYAKYAELKKQFVDNPEMLFYQIPGQSGLDLPASEIKVLADAMRERQKKLNNPIELKLSN